MHQTHRKWTCGNFFINKIDLEQKKVQDQLLRDGPAPYRQPFQLYPEPGNKMQINQ